MISKYGLANETLEALKAASAENNIAEDDAQEALLITIIQSLKELRGAENLRGILQYEVDSLGSGGVHEIQRR